MSDKNVLVVSEKSRTTLESMVACEEGAELLFCTDVLDIEAAETMIDWHIVDQVLVVGSIVNLALLAVIDYAQQLGAPISHWHKPTFH